MRKNGYDEFLYHFAGGEYNGKIWHYAALEIRGLIEGHTENMSAVRNSGRLCEREELDEQPIIDGYLTPMYDGERYEVDGVLKYAFQCTEEEKANASAVYHVIRYETQEEYNILSM